MHVLKSCWASPGLQQAASIQFHFAVHSQAAQSSASPDHAIPEAAPISALVTWDTFRSLAKPGDRLRLTGDAPSAASSAPGPISSAPRATLSASTDSHSSADAALSAAQGLVMPAGRSRTLNIDADVAMWAVSSAEGGPYPDVGPGAAAAAGGAADDTLTAQQQMWRAKPQTTSSQADKFLLLAQVSVQ